jgi:hypothetical protein
MQLVDQYFEQGGVAEDAEVGLPLIVHNMLPLQNTANIGKI